MIETITMIIERIGYLGIALLMFVETIFPPIPSELILPFAGFSAAQGTMSLPLVILTSTIGSMLGTLLIYFIARLLHEEYIVSFIDKRGKYLGITQKDFQRAQQWFDRNGYVAVFLCRLIPGLRSLISIPAGVRRMSFDRFLIISLIGTGAWNIILAWGGFILGNNYHVIESAVDSFSKVVYVVCGLLVVGLLAYRLLINPRREKVRSSNS